MNKKYIEMSKIVPLSVKSSTIFLFIILTLISCNEKQNIEHLIFKNGIPFKPDSEKPYSGTIFKLDKNGKIEFEGKILDGKQHGEWKFYENNLIKTINNYNLGIKDGESISYDQIGDVIIKENYKNGKENGKFISYWSKDIIQNESQYENGRKVGKWIGYNMQSIKLYEINYINGTIDLPISRFWHDNGKLKCEFKKLDTEKYEQTYFYDNGNVKEIIRYSLENYPKVEDDFRVRFMSGINGTPKGNTLITEWEINPDHFILNREYYNMNGKIEKVIKYFYPNFGVVKKRYYNNEIEIYDDVESYTEIFDPNGIIIEKCAKTKGGELGCVGKSTYNEQPTSYLELITNSN
jgi:antitoxin component YwqK of YwqJK toxin-antitoxin module